MKKATFRAWLAALALAACGDATGPFTPAAGEVVASAVSGNGQSGVVGQALPDSVVIRVTTTGGAPARGLTLEWRVLAGEGGELLASTTETDRDGRSGNLWVLGRTPGEQRVEVRARVRDGVAVLDTLVAQARAGAPRTLRVSVDPGRTIAVGDTFRLAVQGEDRFGNPIPAAELRASWQSLDPEVVAADTAGRLRATGLGAAAVQVAAGEVTARAVVQVGARVERYPSSFRMAASQISRLSENGGRVVAVGTWTARTTVGSLAFELRDSAFQGQALCCGLVATTLHVTPGGAGYAVMGLVHQSPSAGAPWTPAPRAETWFAVAGSGETLFGVAQAGYQWESTCRIRVERLSGGTLTDLRFPASHAACNYGDVSLAAAGPGELYVGTRQGTLRWDGAQWSEVVRPDGEGALLPRLLTAPPGGGSVLAVVGRSLVYQLRGGTAARVRNPVEDAGETVVGAAVDEAGRAYLTYRLGVAFQGPRGWTEYPVGDGWTASSGVAPSRDGGAWVAVTRVTDVRTYYGPEVEFALLRIRTRAP